MWLLLLLPLENKRAGVETRVLLKKQNQNKYKKKVHKDCAKSINCNFDMKKCMYQFQVLFNRDNDFTMNFSVRR